MPFPLARLSALAALAGMAAAWPARSQDYLDPRLPLETRVADLVSRLTLAEKVSLMGQSQPAIPRLGIAAHQIWSEALHGIAYQNATVFPQAIGLGHTWDPELVRAVASAIADEGRVFHRRSPTTLGLSYWSPVVDLARDPRWGRTEEAYSEDPYLSAAIGGAFVRGMQGDDPLHFKTIPTLKHFAANSMENGRQSTSSNADPRNLREYYLRPFEKITREQHVQSYMAAYNAINSVPCTISNLFRDVARAEWGFDGYIVTDAGDLTSLISQHHYTTDMSRGAALIVKAGIDSISEPDPSGAVQGALAQGLLSESDLDTALRRNLRARFLVGEFDPPEMDPYGNIPDSELLSPEHAALARQAGRESVVLLKNAGNLLPLDASKLKSVAVIGPNANIVYRDWYAGNLVNPVSPRAGIERRLPSATITFDDGATRIALRARANGRWVTSAPGLLTAMDATSDARQLSGAATFLADDWGWGCTTLRSGQSNQYVTTSGSGMAASSATAYAWNYSFCFNFVAQPEGGYAIQYYNGQYLSLDGSWVLRLNRPGAPSTFDIVTVSNGPQRAAAAAGQADVALVVVGNNTTINGKENQDRPDIILPPAQDNLISAVAAANPNTVVVLKAGYPVAINAAQKSVPAILYSSHGGQEEGNFLADVLFGDYNPGGRLTETWFQSQDDLPPIADFDIRKGSTYWYFQGEPLYPFGHGLSYTTFTYSNFAASSGDPIQISVDVRNTGARAGDEVVQLYTKALGSKVQRPIQELKRFQRISLQPGETKTARFTLPVSELSFWDVRRGAFTVEKGSVDLRVGASSRDIRLSQPVSVNGETLAPRNARAVIRAENYDEYSNVLLGQSGDGVQVAASATDGAWLLFREVDFGAGVNSMTMRAGGVPGGVEAHLDRVDGPSMGTCAISPARSATTPAVLTCPTMTASGVHDLYLVFRVAASFYVDWFTFGAAASSGAPSIDEGGVVDAAGYTQPLLRGSWATVYGKNLARTTRGWAAADFRGAAMPQSLDGTQVLVNGVPAPVWYVSSSQVNFQVPSGVPLGPAAVQVLTAAGVSAPAVAPIDETQPAFFFSAAGGKNWAVAQHRDWSLIGPSGTPAQPGETIVLWGSGFGQTSPPVSPGFMQTAPAPLADAAGIRVTIGGQSATVYYAGMTVAGGYQINAAVPTLPDGDYEVAATVGSRTTKVNVWLTVRR